MKTYIYKGERGALVDLMLDKVAGLMPKDDDSNYGFYSLADLEAAGIELSSDETGTTYEGDEYLSEDEIVCTDVRDRENGQRLITRWVTKRYADDDEYERELLVATDRYHGWTSKRTEYVREARRYIDKEDWSGLSRLSISWDGLREEWASKPERSEEAEPLLCIPEVEDYLDEAIGCGTIHGKKAFQTARLDDLFTLADAVGGNVNYQRKRDGQCWETVGTVGGCVLLDEDFPWRFGADTRVFFFYADRGAVEGYRRALEELRRDWQEVREDEDEDEDEAGGVVFAENPTIVEHLSNLRDDEFAIYIQPWGEADLEEWNTLSQYATQWHDNDVTEYRHVLTLD